MQRPHREVPEAALAQLLSHGALLDTHLVFLIPHPLVLPPMPAVLLPFRRKENVGLAWLWFFFFRDGLRLTLGSVLPLRQPPVP